MMKKILSLSLLIVFVLAAISYADAPDTSKARTAQLATGIEQVVSIGDVSSGYTPNVTPSGALATTNIARAVDSRYGDGQLYTGACYVQGIYISSPTAGDYAAIFDGTASSYTPVFDPMIDTNSSSTYIDTKGCYFATGIYADVTDDDTLVTAVYDY